MQCAPQKLSAIDHHGKGERPNETRAIFLTLRNCHLMRSVLEGSCFSVSSQLKAGMCSLVRECGVCLSWDEVRVTSTAPWFFTCAIPSRSWLAVRQEAPIPVITHHAQWLQDLRGSYTSFLPSPGGAATFLLGQNLSAPLRSGAKLPN